MGGGETPTETTEAPKGDAPTANDWRTGLSEDYRSKYTEFKTMDDVFKGYDGLVKKMGQNPIVKPAEGADETEVSEYRKTLQKELGVSDKVEDYNIELSDDVPEVLRGAYSGEVLGEYAKAAMEKGVTPDAFEALVNMNVEQRVNELNAMHETTMQMLEEKHGDKKDEVIKQTTEFTREFAPEVLNDPLLSNHPVVVDLLQKVASNFGDKIGEGKVQGFEGQSPSNIDSLENRRLELLNKVNDGKLTLDERQEANKELSQVYQKLYGNRK